MFTDAEDGYSNERSGYTCLAVRKRNATRLLRTSGRRNSGRTGIRRNSRTFFWLLIFFAGCFPASWGDSLWSTDFTGYLTDGAQFAVGDTFTVSIDSDFDLSYRSTSVDAKSVTLEFSGGEYGDLFAFLPAVRTSGDRDVKGSDEHSMVSRLAVGVVRIEEDGTLSVQGSRTLVIDAKEESLTLSGRVDPRDVGQSREISIDRVVDVRVVYRSLLLPTEDVLSGEDIEEVLRDLGGEAEAPEQPAAPGGGETETGPEGVSSAPRLSDQKKKELFLRYVNRLMNLIFQ
jgi:hypothetical protein